MAIKRLSDINWKALVASRGFHPSPTEWEDHVFYFLMVDRFSDGKENSFRDIAGNVVTAGSTPMFSAAENQNAIKNEEDAKKWREAGTKYVHGKLKGLTSKIGYLVRCGSIPH